MTELMQYLLAAAVGYVAFELALVIYERSSPREKLLRRLQYAIETYGVDSEEAAEIRAELAAMFSASAGVAKPESSA